MKYPPLNSVKVCPKCGAKPGEWVAGNFRMLYRPDKKGILRICFRCYHEWYEATIEPPA